MKSSLQYRAICAISLHFSDGSANLYRSAELERLISDLTIDKTIIFAVVNFEHRALPKIIRNVQELVNFLDFRVKAQMFREELC